MFKVNKKGMFQECYSAVFMISLEDILKPVVESDFSKSSGLYIGNKDGALLLVKLQAFTVNASERINDRVCF